MFTNPTTPNLTDYVTFLYSAVGIPSKNLPSASGTATGGSTTTLVDTSQTWTANQWAGAALYDSTQGLLATVASNTANTLTFSTALATAVAAGDAYLVMNSFIQTTFNVAKEVVNTDISLASPTIYTLAVYNLGADRLLNYAIDQPNQTYFQDLRTKLRLNDPSLGVVAASSDETTSMTSLNPESMKFFTLQDLQTLKTPYGRTYMGFAQSYGSNIWGLT
jgi:hypothetical protein